MIDIKTIEESIKNWKDRKYDYEKDKDKIIAMFKSLKYLEIIVTDKRDKNNNIENRIKIRQIGHLNNFMKVDIFIEDNWCITIIDIKTMYLHKDIIDIFITKEDLA